MTGAARAVTEAETEEGIAAEADAADALAVGVAAAEEAEEETAGIKADGTCHLRNTRRHRAANVIREATTIAGHRAEIADPGHWHRWIHARMTLCCRASRWRNIAGGRNKLLNL
jgi:hypothetical protein